MKMDLSILISNILLRLNLQIINKKIYHDSFFTREVDRMMQPVLLHYSSLVSQYPTKEDRLKAEENKILFIKMIYWLDLHQQPSLRILDVGGRGGLFAYYCRCYGHEAYVSDLPDVLTKSPNKELRELFKVNSLPLEIKPGTPLNTNGIKFDLITGFRTRFHSRLPFETGKAFEEHWGVEEWDYFLRDTARNILHENGRIFFMLNRLQEKEKKEYVPQNLAEYFRLKGGQLRQQYLLFPATAHILS